MTNHMQPCRTFKEAKGHTDEGEWKQYQKFPFRYKHEYYAVTVKPNLILTHLNTRESLALKAASSQVFYFVKPGSTHLLVGPIQSKHIFIF